MKLKFTKKLLLWSLMPISSIGIVLVLVFAITNRASSSFDKNDSLIPSIPNKPINPSDPNSPSIPSNPLKPNQIVLYFRNQDDLVREINTAYSSNLKHDLLKLAKQDIATSGILGVIVDPNIIDNYCTVALPNNVTIDNLDIETLIDNDTYRLKTFKNLKVDINPKNGGSPMSIRINLFDANWDITFLKK